MKKLKTPVKIILVVLALALTNLITGRIVYSIKQKEYDGFKQRTQTLVDQKIAIQNELEELQMLCPEGDEAEEALLQ